jgi:tetratricopeptide (TPR) repeat protein
MLIFSAHAFAGERAELYMAKAIFAMNLGQDEKAFSWFSKVLAVSPDHVTALHLQGVTASRLGRYAQAELILKRCIEQPSAPKEAHFDLGYVLYSKGRYQEAAVQFKLAKQKGVDEPALPYYLGATLFRLADFEAAIASLTQALETVPAHEAGARYYLGVAYYALGKYSRSQRNLEKMIDLAPGTRLAQKAETLLHAVIRDKNLAKWWDVWFEVGGAYDTNVLYEPEDFAVSGQPGFYGYSAFDATLYPLKKPFGSIGLGYSYFQSLHVDSEEELLGEYDLLRHAGRVEGLARLWRGVPGAFFGVDYELSYASLGGRHYQDLHNIFPYVKVIETPYTATRASGQVEIKRFPDYQERDGLFIASAVTQIFSFMQRRGRAAVEIAYQQNDAESDNYDYLGIKGFFGAQVPLVQNLSGVAGFQYRYLDYNHHLEGRIDRKIVTDVGLNYTFLEYFALNFNYRYARNQSLERYTWQKHVPSLSFQVYF